MDSQAILDGIKQMLDDLHITFPDLLLISFSIGIFCTLLSSCIGFMKTVVSPPSHRATHRDAQPASSDPGKFSDIENHVKSCKFSCLHSECAFYNSFCSPYCYKCDRYSMCSHCIHEGKCIK